MNDKHFGSVPREQYEVLLTFKATHPVKSLQVGGETWNYLMSGQGPKTLVILVGGSRMAEMAFKLISAFEREYRVIVPTYPDILELKLLEEGIAAILDSEGAKQVSMIGASFGGMIAQGFVRRYPERVEKLILSNTAGNFSPEYAQKLEQGLKMIRWLPMWLMRSKSRRQFIRHSAAFPPEEKAFWEAVLMSIVDDMTKSSLKSQFACMRDIHNRHFTSEDLRQWNGSILVIESNSDPSFDEGMRRSMHVLYPHAHFLNLPDAGHIPMITDWKTYRYAIQEFLAENEREPTV